MGISNGLEIGSMDSETMSVCNKGPIKANAGQKDSDVKTASEIIDQLKANHAINPVSPIPQEAETIVIDDDHEPEEGEITNTDDEIVANETADFEYEAISSEEEFSLRQKIEALEARNLELEKIASISCYSRENFNSYKTLTIEDGTLHHHTNRKNFTRKIPPPSNHSVTNSRQIISSALPAHIENISSDEEPTIDNENDYLLNNSKYVGRTMHRVTKKEKRRKKEKRHKYDDRKTERSTVKQQPFKAYSYSSGSDNETLLRNRDELIMALNMNEQTRRSTSKSTLYDKLSALQKQPHDDNRKSSSTSSLAKRKRCKSFDSPTIEPVKRKTEPSGDYKKKRKKLSLPADEEDELHSLEEQELRLMALKSAVLKKHEARKKRQAATQQQTARPYSPTDSVIADESGERSIDCIDSDNNNMDISPISSPGGGNQCQPMDMELASSNESSKSPLFCQNTIIFDEQYVDWGTSIAVPVPFNATYIEIDQSTRMNHQFPNMFGQNQMTAGFEPVNEEIIGNNMTGGGAVNVDSEDELRAQLIEQLRNQNSSNSNSGIETITMTVDDDEIQTKKHNDELSQVDTLEEDCLRSLLLSSKGKKSKAIDVQTTSPKIEATVQRISVKQDGESEWGMNDDLPKLTMNLREALKRLKSNQTKVQPIPIAKPKVKTNAVTASVPILETKTLNSNVLEVEQPKNKEIVNNETIKTVIEENNKKELDNVTKTAATIAHEPSKRKPTEPLQPKDVPVKQTKPKVGGTVVTKKLTAVKSATKAAKIVTQTKKETETVVAKPVTKATIKKPILSTNLDALRKSTSSPIITMWKPRPVKRLIISLNTDSSSDDTDDNDRENQLPNKTDLNSSTNSNNVDSSNAFQLRLDQFLQSVRKNTDAIQEPKKSSATVAPAAKAAKKSILTTSQKQAQPEPKVEESKAVRHLPLSSRLEYHRLISRMKLLEKQKEQKSRTTKITPANQSQAQNASPSATNPNPIEPKTNFPELTVVLLNDRCTQSNRDIISNKETQKSLIQSTIKSPALSSTINNSLAKQVLVRNTIENLISEEVKLAASTSSKDINETTAAITQIAKATLDSSSVQKEQPLNNASKSECPKKPAILSSISIADLSTKAPKVQATVLANYEKRYHTHEETYLNDLIKVHRLTSRTNLETRKQQKLEQDLNELRKKMQLTEESLTRQNNLMKNLYPAVAMAEKTAISSRTQLLKLETSCKRLGAIIQSTDYKIKCDKEEDIKTKLKQISVEKLKLKQLDPTAIVTISKRIGLLQANAQKAAAKIVANNSNQGTVFSESSTVAAGDQLTKDIEKPAVAIPEENVAIQEVIISATNTVSSPEAPITAQHSTKSTEGNEISIEDIPKDETPTANPELEPELVKEEPAQEESIKEETATKEPTINKELIKSTLQKDKGNESGTQILTSEPNHQLKVPHEIFFSAAAEISGKQIMDDDTVYGKYSSPLQHLKCDKENESSTTEQSLDLIICPFDLMGRCEDKQCKYRHLSM